MWHGIKLGIFILALVTVFSFAVHSDFSSASPTVTKPNKQYQVDKEVEVPAKAYVIFDAKTGAVLGKKNVNEVVPIASVTKLFTAAALNERDLSASSTVTWADVAAEEDFGKLEAGHEYQLRELLFPLLIESSNDAAAHLERVTSGGVLHDMNSLAKQVGLPDTYLYDASGLSVKNVSTATDLARFLSYLYTNEPHLLDITTLKQYVGPYTGWVNNNPVLDKTYVGGKHGYTEAAGRTGAFLFKEDISGTTRTIGYVVLGSKNLTADVSQLRDFVHTHVRYQ